MEPHQVSLIKQHKKLPKAEIGKRMVLICSGAVLMAVGLEIFLVPNRIIDGGIVGISIILSHLTNLKLSLFLFSSMSLSCSSAIIRLEKHLLFLLCLVSSC